MSPHTNKNTAINFFCEDIEYKLENRETVIQWLSNVYKSENQSLATLNYIFCSDAYLLKINKEYLNHDTLTDIITFPNSRRGAAIAGDIFISIERVRDNALDFGVSFEKELLRVLVHGSLHLLGYKDKTPDEQKVMTQKENFYISKFSES